MTTGTTSMLAVSAGPFIAGCDSATDPMCEPDETPAHSITLPAFRIDATEVTQAEYRDCIEARACSAPYHGPTPWEGEACVHAWDPEARPARAVTCVSWAQASAFCAWAGKRLPTETEWEKAARGTDGRVFPWGSAAADCTRVSMEGCLGDVAQHSSGRSPYGAWDMAGGAWEWTASWYSAALWKDVKNEARGGPEHGEFRVVRGCELNALHASARDVRAANRFSLAPEHAAVRLGFRCAK